MGVREMDRFLEQWQMDAKALRRRMILAPTPRERERWYALWLLTRLVWTESQPPDFILYWSWWRCRHQAQARRCHYRRRLSLLDSIVQL